MNSVQRSAVVTPGKSGHRGSISFASGVIGIRETQLGSAEHDTAKVISQQGVVAVPGSVVTPFSKPRLSGSQSLPRPRSSIFPSSPQSSHADDNILIGGLNVTSSPHRHRSSSKRSLSQAFDEAALRSIKSQSLASQSSTPCSTDDPIS